MSNIISTFNFKSIPVRIEIKNNEPFFCLLDVASILGLGNRSISKFKFNPKGVEKLSTPTTGGMQEVVFINEPNLYRVIFRSNKAEAVDFQNWVFEEVLPQIRKTGKYERQQQLALPVPKRKFTFEFTEDELQQLAWAWFAFLRGAHTFQDIYPAFEKLGSKYSGAIYGQAYEYRDTIRNAQKIIARITAEFEINPMSNWRVLKHVRGFDPTFKTFTI